MKTLNTSELVTKVFSDEKDIKDFLGILKVTQKFYSMYPSSNHPSPAFLNREELLVADPLNIHMEVFQLTEPYQYAIKAYDKSKREFDEITCTWIHIDGIQQERDKFSKKDPTHPVFSIINLTDIFNR